MYDKPAKSPDYPKLEERILAFWKAEGIFDKLREQNRGGPRFSFLDGPITANNPMGVHHAWGRSLKDMYQRYHAMQGEELRYQNGFDCQGLWVEVEVEKEHGFATKKEIEEYGMARFIEDCKERVRKYSRIQTDQSIRLGYWMDWQNSYYTMSDENNYCIWEFLARCHKRGFIYRGFDAMPWCPRCGVGLSQMEMHEGYAWVRDLSVFVAFPLRERENEALLVWTTTPWTLTSNVAAAVHPEMTYLRVGVGEKVYIVGAENFEAARQVEMDEPGKKRQLMKLKSIKDLLPGYRIEGEVKGKDLLGLAYDGPFDELEAQTTMGGYPHKSDLALRAVDCHRVIAWDAVTGGEGTGIVHIAPGCGKEDFELGKEERIVAVSPLDEAGRFLDAFGTLAGRYAHEVALDVAKMLDAKGRLLAKEKYPHRYAHCWRCGTAILYRMVHEWFISMDWRDKIMETVPQIRWIPEYGKDRELDWLRNMGDWMISKKRYWGLALPIWSCDDEGCDWFTVIGSKEDLRASAIEGFDEFDGHTPHRPFVDAVKVRCEKCDGKASRIPDVGNPWLDAGIVPYSTIGYKIDPDLFRDWFPADLVLECFPGQFRNWFYALLAMNAMMQEESWEQDAPVRPPFRTLLGHALVRDEQGKEMHKSLGNAIEFNDAASRVGAEVMRYIYAGQNPTANLNFPDISKGRRKDVVHLDEQVRRRLLTLWNCFSFYITYAEVDGITPDTLAIPAAARSDLDRFILSKLQGLIGFAHDAFTDYRLHQLPGRFERFLDTLSNWYLRRSRRRFWKSESDEDKLAAFATLFEVLLSLCRLMAPLLPFLTEEIYRAMVVKVSPDAKPSVHLLSYPKADESLIDKELEQAIDAVIRFKNVGLAARGGAGLKVRQPLGRIRLLTETKTERAALERPELASQLLEELNVKTLDFIDSTDDLLSTEIRPNFKILGKRHGAKTKSIATAIGALDPDAIEAALRTGSLDVTVDGAKVSLQKDEIEIVKKPAEGYAYAGDDQAAVFLDTAISKELRQEGIVRDFVRSIQNQRKAKDLNVTDRIAIQYQADPEVVEAVAVFADYVKKETLADEMEACDTPLDATSKVGGHKITVAIRKQGG